MNSLALTSPTFDYSTDDLDRLDIAESTRIKYRRAWERALSAGVDFMNPDSVVSHTLSLSSSGRLFFSAVMKAKLDAAEYALKSSIDPTRATPESVAIIQAILWKLDALRKSTPTRQDKGIKAHIWLSKQKVDQLTALPDKSTLRGMRDYIVLACLLGIGLRREEMSELTFDALKRLPYKGEYTDVIEVTGKGEVSRVVPISPLLAGHLREWQTMTGGGRVARSINKAGKLGEDLSPVGIFMEIVRPHGARIGLPLLDPHDCRRSFGRLIYDLTHDLILVRDLLGHKDAKTTQRYIGIMIRLDPSASDYIIRPFKFMEVSGD
jgi:integrase